MSKFQQLEIRNKLYHAELWLRSSNPHCPTNASLYGVYDAMHIISEERRKIDVPPSHRRDCTRSKCIKETAIQLGGTDE